MTLQDHHQRRIGYLRLSITKACAMRCRYCRPATLGHTRDPDQLTPAQLETLVRHLVERHGLHKVRLTGGDPTSRPELVEIIQRIAAIPGIRDLAMTTNGLTLASRAKDYAAAGLRRLNISLDTLDPARFTEVTGIDALDRVLEGISAAQTAGLGPIKLNTVVLKDANEHHLIDLIRFAIDRGVEPRFIELMPMGPLADQWTQNYVSAARMRANLSPHVTSWEELPQHHDAARRYRITLSDGRTTTVGFITPMSCNFCDACNRIRVAADGTLYPCLMDKPAGSLRPALAPTYDPDELDNLLLAGLAGKAAEHPHDGYVVMTHIGG